ncbi:hypothetical protein [Comamonas sp. lk]|uniref:hypothetical protein n=1 Tax=Comamonas sp. lk TaxID=2201272 RepID=UPI000EB4C5A2|nr:hypothetical protein [Comamonas sp. lk]
MSVSTLLAIIGPLLALLGAALLAYDAFQAPMQVQRQRHFKSRIDGLLRLHQYLSTTYPSPPYSADEVAAAKTQRDEMMAELQAELETSELNYRLRVSNLALWGFILIALGSCAQVAAAWILA